MGTSVQKYVTRTGNVSCVCLGLEKEKDTQTQMHTHFLYMKMQQFKICDRGWKGLPQDSNLAYVTGRAVDHFEDQDWKVEPDAMKKGQSVKVSEESDCI